ncbi:restriction endonuclease subunit S [Pontiellaceae bacterium B12227]|nr:restriction endonuclease subunit S [Pontiellaceae bacterium B12227]
MKLLSDIAKIKPGHPFRGKLNEDADGDVAVLQLKDITDSFFIDITNASRVDSSIIKSSYLLQEGSVIFRSRGHTNTCAIHHDADTPTVCAAPLFSIDVNPLLALPEYVCWFINQQSAQTYFNRNAKGTSVRMIDREALGNLPIPIPPLKKQREITAIAKLADREQRLMDQLREKKKTLLSGILAQVASGTGIDAENERLPEVVATPQEDKDNHPEP